MTKMYKTKEGLNPRVSGDEETESEDEHDFVNGSSSDMYGGFVT